MDFPNMKEWWSEDPDKVLSFVYWLQRQTPPTDADKRKKALKDVASQLDKKHNAPNKKAIAKFIGESYEDIIIESYDDFVNEARSEASKIAKKTGTTKQIVDELQSLLNDLSSEDLAKALISKIDLNEGEIVKILKMMSKVYEGDLSIRIKP